MTIGGTPFRQALITACLFCIPALSLAPTAHAQSRSITPSGNYTANASADQTKGRALLDGIRSSAIEGDFYFDFQIRLRPKRGATTLVPGRLWSSRNTQGPITRITLSPGSKNDQRDLLIQNGPHSAIWTFPRTNALAPTDTSAPDAPTALFIPLAGTDLTPFELQMPFIYWDNFTYEGLSNATTGRLTHAFLMRPPADIAAAQPNLTGVRFYYDEGYRALTTFEILGPHGIVTKTMRLKQFHIVAGQWFLRKAELRNEATGNGTDFDILLTGVKLALPRDIFTPENLSTPVTPPPLDTLWKSR